LKPSISPVLAEIESLDGEGRGVAHVDGKAVFIDGALPGEVVSYAVFRRKPSYELAETVQVVASSASRTAPRCRYFGLCGGCSMQHLESRAQVAVKQRVLEDALWHIARVRPEIVLPAIHGSAWRYRNRARLSVRHVVKKGGVLVGFHERRSSFVADMESCEVVPSGMSEAIAELRVLIGRLSIRNRLPQIEVSVGDTESALVLRVLEQPGADDESLLKEFAQRKRIQLWLQSGGPGSARPFWPEDARPLEYRLPEFDVRIVFSPTGFTQINFGINRVLVRRALMLLDPQPGERIADLFCGLGNFTLPIARTGARVLGVDGSDELIERARANAEMNGLGRVCEFECANLFQSRSGERLGQFDRLLIDPPREGAIEFVKSIAGHPVRIVYVSCDPATLARDAGVLVNLKNYRLDAAGVVNMFPHTSHVESIAVFTRS